jgi:hypothetical protein
MCPKCAPFLSLTYIKSNNILNLLSMTRGLFIRCSLFNPEYPVLKNVDGLLNSWNAFQERSKNDNNYKELMRCKNKEQRFPHELNKKRQSYLNLPLPWEASSFFYGTSKNLPRLSSDGIL